MLQRSKLVCMKNFAIAVLSVALCATAMAQAHELPPDMRANQMPPMKKKPATPSVQLTATGTAGKSLVFTKDEIAGMQHIQVTVHNAHTDANETYSGVPVSEFVKRVEPGLATGDKTKIRPLMTVIVFGATDHYHVVLTECDIDPSCSKSVVIVADQMEGKPLTVDGAFRLISTGDKKPQRWVRNLSSIQVKAVTEE